MDFTKFKYPLFSTTEDEKKLLRKCELWCAKHPDKYISLHSSCWQLTCIGTMQVSSVNLGHARVDNYVMKELIDLPYRTQNRIRNLIRRIWITKLLNYKGQ
jgi:hypothetical protein